MGDSAWPGHDSGSGEAREDGQSGGLMSVESCLRLVDRRWLATARGIACLAALLSGTPGLRAQDRRDVEWNASLSMGSSFGDGGTALASAIGAGARWPSRLGIAVELSHARKLDFTIDLCPPPRVCVIGGQLPVTGRTLALVPHVTLDLLPSSARVRLYGLAGVGAAHVRQRYFLVPAFFSGDRPELTRSNLTPAIAFGGGATLGVTRRLGLGVDLRSLHVLDDDGEEARFITPAGTLSAIRLGVRVEWGF